MNNGAQRMRRELMILLVHEFTKNTLKDNIDNIPVRLRPKNSEHSRCCIYHDRAVLKYRLMSLLGFDCKNEPDENKPLHEYLQQAIEHPEKPAEPITVCSAGCAGCPPAKIKITENCQGCFARPCVYNCPKGAITVENGKAQIDYSKCIKCGKCLNVCPFNAIFKTKVPCEDACPVGAIKKNEYGVADIDFDRCIRCGKCFQKCPFGAVMERSELLPILQSIKSGKKVIALIAPSAQFQFPGGIEKLFTAVRQAGFFDVIEVASGAEMTIENEAKEFVERMENGDKLMTSSCCTAYVELAKRHVPQILPAVSSTPSPMVYAGRIAREKHPDGVNVFIGPCIAKRQEALTAPEIDMVMTFEELGSLLAGLAIDIMTQEPENFAKPASKFARNFAKSCGVTDAVLEELLSGKENPIKLDTKFMDGIDAKSANLLKLYAAGKLPCNFLEVMSCQGGCVSGPCSLISK